MNGLQKEYIWGKKLHDYGIDIFNVAKILPWLGAWGLCVCTGHDIIGLVPMYAGILKGIDTGVDIGLRGARQLNAKYVLRRPWKYPLEHAESVLIEDKGGLAMLLERTAEQEKLEWTTCLNAYEEQGVAIVHSILNPKVAEEKKLTKKRKKSSVVLKKWKAKWQGFNGFQHYHPPSTSKRLKYGSDNFTVSGQDRFTPNGFINLLTFNMPDGPEVIAFNHNYTYIRESRKSPKDKLVRATPTQIMEYLRD